MGYDRFEKEGPEALGEEDEFYHPKKVSFFSRTGLVLSQVILFIGFFLALIGNMEVFMPGENFSGAYGFIVSGVFTIGIAIIFISIPWLYFSSYDNFKKENKYWDKEIFWIMPLFFFGNFFIYDSEFEFSKIMFTIAVSFVAIVHAVFFGLSFIFTRKRQHEAIANYKGYLISMSYLTLYYVLLILIIVFYNPVKKVFDYVRDFI